MRQQWGKNSESAPKRRYFNTKLLRGRKRANSKGQSPFRRNRTIVGSLSSDVNSINELAGGIHSPRTHAHRLTAHRRSLLYLLTSVILLAALLTWLLYELTASVTVASPIGIQIESARYTTAINDYLDAHPMERLRFVLNDSNLTKYLTQTVPEVASVTENSLSGFASSQFDITFRHPIASWLIGQTQYYVDENGVPFKMNYYNKPSVKILDQSGVPETTGDSVASSRFLEFVGRTVTLAKADNLEVAQAIIPPDTTHQIEVIVTGRSYPIKMSLDRPVGGQVEDMMNAIKYFDTHSIHPAYVDVRVSGEAYYK